MVTAGVASASLRCYFQKFERVESSVRNTLDIVILTPWFPNQPDGWPARFISDSALAMARMGHRIRIGVTRGFVPPGMTRWVRAEHRGEIDINAFDKIETIRERRHFALPKGLFRGITNRSLDAAARQLLTQFITERKPDVVLVHTETLAPSTVGSAHALGLPIVVTLHGQNTNLAYLARDGQKERFHAALTKADRLTVVGRPLVPYAEMLAGRNDHIEVIWNGVDSPESMRVIPDPDDAPVELIAVANLQEGKGIDLLLKALVQLDLEGLNDWHLRIIGEGPMGSDLRLMTKCAGLDDRVCFLGARTNSQVFKELVQSDVFVLPSYREAFGVAYLEAMACGLLTIGVIEEGPSQFISDQETGLLIAPQSVDAIVTVLRSVLTGSRSNWRDIAMRGAKFVRSQMTWDAHARHLTNTLASIVDATTRSNFY